MCTTLSNRVNFFKKETLQLCLHGETTSVFSLSDATTRRTVLRRYGRLGSPRGVRRGAREAWCDWDRAEGGDGGHRRRMRWV